MAQNESKYSRDMWRPLCIGKCSICNKVWLWLYELNKTFTLTFILVYDLQTSPTRTCYNFRCVVLFVLLCNQYKQTWREGYTSKEEDSGENQRRYAHSGWVKRWWSFYTRITHYGLIADNKSKHCHQHFQHYGLIQ